MANRVILNTVSFHGAGAIKEIPALAKNRGFKKVFICSDPDLVKFGVTKKVTDLLDEAAIPYSLYSDIKPNPTIQNVQAYILFKRKILFFRIKMIEMCFYFARIFTVSRKICQLMTESFYNNAIVVVITSAVIRQAVFCLISLT